MAKEFQHKDPGSTLTSAEFITTDGTGHIVESQATGDILYASSATVLKALAKGSNGDVLSLAAGIPDWTTSAASATVASTVVVIDTTDTSAFVALFDDATGSLAIKTDTSITYNAGTGTLTVTAFLGTIDGVVGGNTPAAITGTTIDANTDFTVGSTVITDDVVTFTPTSSDTVVLTAATHGAFSIVTTDDNAAAANIQITADGTVDIDSVGVLTLDSGAAINIEPAAGSAVLIDGNVSIDGDAVTGIATLAASGVITAGGFTIGSAAITEAELEILDGATVTTTELNLLDALDRGSILYGNPSGVTTVLGQGTTDQILTSDGTDIAWQDPAGSGLSAASEVEMAAGESNTVAATPGRLQFHQGVVAVWCQVQADGTSLDSYNVASTGKDSTGIYTVTIADDLANTYYAGAACSNSGVCKVVNINSLGLGAYKAECVDVSESAIDTANTNIICGELA
jgi:hypothetical protein